MQKYPHLIESDGNRGIVITAGDEAIIFKKEIKEGEYNLKKDLIITHKYQSVSQPVQVSNNPVLSAQPEAAPSPVLSDEDYEGGEPDDDAQNDGDEDFELKYFVINHIYECEIAVTNLTNRHKKVTLLF